jgi:hypothetical protein
MRFILNFFFFGLLFYLIYLFFPDAFSTLVSWANSAYQYLRDLFVQVTGRERVIENPHPEAPAALLPLWILLDYLKAALSTR